MRHLCRWPSTTPPPTTVIIGVLPPGGGIVCFAEIVPHREENSRYPFFCFLLPLYPGGSLPAGGLINIFKLIVVHTYRQQWRTRSGHKDPDEDSDKKGGIPDRRS